ECFRQKGGTRDAPRHIPDAAPGLLSSEEEQNQIRTLSRSLFQGASPSARFVQNENTELPGVLNRLLRPDVRLSPETPGIGFVHRRTRDAEIYFLANTSNL